MRFTLLCLLSARCGGLAVGRRAFCAGSVGGAKEAGKWRSEGKEYVVQEGDVMLFRFNN